MRALARRLQLMRLRRRPPFALVLVAVAAAMGGAFLLVAGGAGGPAGGGSHPPAPKFAGSGPDRQCVTAHAQFTAGRTTKIRIPVEAAAPVKATARATVGRVTVTATLSKRVVEHATVTRKVFARQDAIARRRACVRAATAQAAHTIALNKAYHAALAAARAAADHQATESLASLVAHVRPATRAEAERMVRVRAQTAAMAAHRALAHQALAQATAEAVARNKLARSRR